MLIAMGAGPLSRLRGKLSDSVGELLLGRSAVGARFAGDRLRDTLGIADADGALVMLLLLSKSLNWEVLRFEVSEDAPPLLPTDSWRLRSTK